jgi:hypothetical protein
MRLSRFALWCRNFCKCIGINLSRVNKKGASENETLSTSRNNAIFRFALGPQDPPDTSEYTWCGRGSVLSIEGPRKGGPGITLRAGHGITDLHLQAAHPKIAD